MLDDGNDDGMQEEGIAEGREDVGCDEDGRLVEGLLLDGLEVEGIVDGRLLVGWCELKDVRN